MRKLAKPKFRAGFFMRRLFCALTVACIFPVAACFPRPKASTSAMQAITREPLKRCVALRGNGTHLMAHTTALAKITSRWGEIQGMAGGSSGTIITFLYESILMNPAVDFLKGEQRSRAISLLLKSIAGYTQEAMDAPEWKALVGIGTLARRLKGHPSLYSSPAEFQKTVADLMQIFSSDDIRELINPEIIDALDPANVQNTGGYKKRVEEVKKAAIALVDLDASDPDVFFRPGLINFPHLIESVGRIADFYAGYGGSQEEMAGFIAACGTGTEEKSWKELATKMTSQGTCSVRFSGLVRDWKKNRNTTTKSRLMDEQGSRLKNIMITAVVAEPAAITAFRRYNKDYRRGAPRQLNFNFANVGFGYWVSSSIGLDPVKAWRESDTDLKSRKAINLGHAKAWREILEKSPQEPSLGSYTEFAGGEAMAGALSLGGWADLHPVQVLKAAGCGKVIYVTRRGPETTFISAGVPYLGRQKSGLAELLGMTESTYNELYNLASTESGFSRAVAQADGVWCTDWNRFSAFEQEGIAASGWSAPFLTRDPSFSHWSEVDGSGSKIAGCR